MTYTQENLRNELWTNRNTAVNHKGSHTFILPHGELGESQKRLK